MKAITRTEYGPADVLRLVDVPVPEPGDDDVLIRVAAAGVGPEVWHVMSGCPEMVRLMGFGFRRPEEPALGQDLAGTVESVGRNVTDLRPGDAVFGRAGRGGGGVGVGGVGGGGVPAHHPTPLRHPSTGRGGRRAGTRPRSR